MSNIELFVSDALLYFVKEHFVYLVLYNGAPKAQAVFKNTKTAADFYNCLRLFCAQLSMFSKATLLN